MEERKIFPRSEFLPVREELRRRGRKLVFTNGCFDLLHAGHVRLFREARSLGDALVVALNDDASVRRLKGPSRPVTPLAERLEVLEAVEAVSYLTWFAEDTPREIVAALLPDVLVKGGDWTPETVVGREEVEAAGGRVVIIPYLPGHSTSSILERIRGEKKSSPPPSSRTGE
ncbi:MAG: D-glycero-beta-D-manno-heptose 1-phosphate adenylyltransferase [Candidatus Aminicenantes bacterium]|nr:D-glycero-beta-D-manno-heptose 1-phosphate adenylyltransferase [Candidatus Aminicenantes bacterium]